MLHVAKLILKNRCWQGEMYNNKSYILYATISSNEYMKMQHATCNKQQYLKYIDKVGSLLYRKKTA